MFDLLCTGDDMIKHISAFIEEILLTFFTKFEADFTLVDGILSGSCAIRFAEFPPVFRKKIVITDSHYIHHGWPFMHWRRYDYTYLRPRDEIAPEFATEFEVRNKLIH